MHADSVDDERVACSAITQHRPGQHENTPFERVQIRISTRSFLENNKERFNPAALLNKEMKQRIPCHGMLRMGS